jgi:hypothetical protein
LLTSHVEQFILSSPSREAEWRRTRKRNKPGWRQSGKVMLEATCNAVRRGGFLANKRSEEKEL